ncbi:MAG: enoyl-CoA hydratase/isomerase family protein [archaeon]|nr:enoyl-CoA hydratase/isomerase family protein [archaeon]
MKNGVKTLQMNRPLQLNPWTFHMQEYFFRLFEEAAKDEAVKAVILTGTGRFYSAGVSFASLFNRPMSPRAAHEMLRTSNERLFSLFLDFPKPLVVAANGPAVGATVTSATLCDAIVAADTAYFSTPFARLSIPPEGCSSAHFPRLLGPDNARRMLREDWAPDAREALSIGLVHSVVPGPDLLPAAQQLAEEIVASRRPKPLVQQGLLEEYHRVNARESKDLADAVFDYPFLRAQYTLWKSKGKTREAAIFGGLYLLRPLWGLFL